jgi:hypothetical protein
VANYQNADKNLLRFPDKIGFSKGIVILSGTKYSNLTVFSTLKLGQKMGGDAYNFALILVWVETDLVAVSVLAEI